MREFFALRWCERRHGSCDRRRILLRDNMALDPNDGVIVRTLDRLEKRVVASREGAKSAGAKPEAFASSDADACCHFRPRVAGPCGEIGTSPKPGTATPAL